MLLVNKIFQKLKLPDFNINKQQNLDLPLQSHTTNNAYQLWLHHEYEEWEQQNLWLALSFPTEKIQLCIRSEASQCTGTKEDEVRTDLAFSSAYVRYSRRTLWIILWPMTDLWKKVIQNKLILCCLSLSTGNTNRIKISFSTLTDNLADFHPVFKYIYMKIKQNTSCYLMVQCLT